MTAVGRRELPVDRTVPACARLADFLRDRRRLSGLTYRQMAQRVGGLPSAATFERCAAGTAVTSWDNIEIFVTVTVTPDEAFNGDLGVALAHAQQLWIRARRATRASYYLHKAPDPDLISSKADFSRALRDQHVWGGSPSPGEMERDAGPGVLPRSTVRRIIKGQSLPVTQDQAIAYLLVCYVPPPDVTRWLTAASHLLQQTPSTKDDLASRNEREKRNQQEPAGLRAVA